MTCPSFQPPRHITVDRGCGAAQPGPFSGERCQPHTVYPIMPAPIVRCDGVLCRPRVQTGYIGYRCPGTWVTLAPTLTGGGWMPRLETNPVLERRHFIHDFDSGHWTMTELCLRYGISRNTGYKWLNRYRQSGASGLHRPFVLSARLQDVINIRGRKDRVTSLLQHPHDETPDHVLVLHDENGLGSPGERRLLF